MYIATDYKKKTRFIKNNSGLRIELFHADVAVRIVYS